MSYRDRDPDQYGQDHYGRNQYDPQHQADVGPSGHSQFGQRPQGQSPGHWSAGPGQFGQSRHDPHRDESHRGSQERDARDWQGRPQRDNSPFASQPSGHAPFYHSAFGESAPPRYFGTGAQGYGGGPSFTGGTYGTADWRSDAPYFDEVGFNRGNYENPLQRENEGQSWQRHTNAGPHSNAPRGRTQRRYPAGPKGYTRSDERLREDISERLMYAHDIDSSDVTVQVQGGKVVLEGTVPTRYMKHAIEDMADAAPGVQDVDNRIRVASSRMEGDASGLNTGGIGASTSGGTATGATIAGGVTSNGRTTARRDS